METQRYLYETHMHTSEASACSGSTGAQMARAYNRHYCNGSLFLRKYFSGPFPAVGGVGTALLSRI